MSDGAHKEDEFKKILRTLFAEKKRVRELEKQLDGKGLQKKFQTQLSDIHRISIAEEYAKLKSAYHEKEKECETLHGHLEKVKPALKKLVTALKESREEVELLKLQKPHEAALKEKEVQLREAHDAIALLEEEKKSLIDLHKQNHSEEISFLQKQVNALEEALKISKKQLEEKELEILHLKENEQKESQRFEIERGRQVERLAESLSQVQRQGQLIEDLRRDNGDLKHEFQRLVDQKETLSNRLEETKLELAKSVQELEQKDVERKRLRQELDEANLQLQATDLAEVRADYEEKLRILSSENQDLKNHLVSQEEAHQQLLEKGYQKMREFSQKHVLITEQHHRLQVQIDEKNERLSKTEKELLSLEISLQNVKLQSENRGREIRKAQQHLAKKVKETTILRDLTERQKFQIEDLKTTLEKLRADREVMQNSLDLQKMQEEKIQNLAKERADTAELLTKEWQEKFLSLQQDWQEKKAELLELKKLRKNYDQMASTFSNLKNLVGKINSTEESESPAEKY